ncbi:hypothetical protein AB7M69_000970 [Bradyrhizobium japonicum]
MLDVTTAHEIAADARVRANVVRLAAAQALTGANSAVIFATGSIVGATLAPDMSFATVPISMYVLGLAAGTLPTGAISRRFGRRAAFIVGTGLGTLTGLCGSFAILHASFALFCVATFLGGLYGAVAQSYRFAAADGASAAYRPKAVSWVMAGGVFAGVLGPQLVQWTMDVWSPYLFAFSFLVQAAVALVAMGIVAGVDMPKPAPADLHGGRPLLDIVTQPRFIAAALCGVISYPMMNLVMTSAPLAMKMCGLSVSDSNFGHSMAHRRHVRAELLHRRAHRALRRAQDRRRRPAAGGRGRGYRSFRPHRDAFLGHADRARCRLEFLLHRRLRAGAGDAPSAGAQQGAGLQRFPGVRHDGDRLVLLRPVAGELRLVRGEHGGIPAGGARPRRALAGVLGPPPQGAVGRGDGRIPGCDLNWREAGGSVDSSIQVEVIFG